MPCLGKADRLTGICRFADCPPFIHFRQKHRLPQNPRSVIMFAFPYYAGDFPDRNVARYACGRDYHSVCAGILEEAAREYREQYPGEEFIAFVDTSPILEVHAAALAGLGVIGRHGMLIHEQYGSRVFLGEIITSMELAPAAPGKQDCSGCGLCVKACPTGAITPDKKLDRLLCRSAITQKKGALTDWERTQISAGGLVWGCDLCTDACPFNQKPTITTIDAFRVEITPTLTPEILHELIAGKAYSYRGPSVLLRNLEILASET